MRPSTSSSFPDSIGVGGSSKPSDGLRAKFPHYRYVDIVQAEHRLVTEHLNVRHLRLVLGSSMGGMHTWMWGEMYPDLMDGLVPIASQPIGISGRNWMLRRRLRIEAIKNDPEYNSGNYTKNPSTYVYTLPLAANEHRNVVRLQEMAPTREAGDEMYKRLVEEAKKGDANNTLYGIEAVMDYDPSKDLEKIKARLLAINFEDDEGNPPQLNVLDPAIKRIKNARHVVIPAGPETHGHYSHLRAKLWKSHLVEFMKTLAETLNKPGGSQCAWPLAYWQPCSCSRRRRSSRKAGRNTATPRKASWSICRREPRSETITVHDSERRIGAGARCSSPRKARTATTMTVVNLSSSAVDDDGTKAMAYEAADAAPARTGPLR